MELTDAIANAFYEETVGNQFLLAILYKLVQDQAIIDETETFDVNTIHKVADIRLGLTKQQRQDMREGRDVDLSLYEHLWRAPAVPEELTAQKQPSQEDLLQSFVPNLASVFGISMQDARKVARQAAAALPEEKEPAKLMLFAAKLLEQSGTDGGSSEKDPGNGQ